MNSDNNKSKDITNIYESISKTLPFFTKKATLEELLLSYSQASDKLAKNLYTRSGLYLLAGVLVAFSGIFFFYLQSTMISRNLHFLALVAYLAPRFGILFFVEYVAFFFLKQYQSTLDEFRYYEAVKRNREENYALIKYANEHKIKLDIFELINESKFYSDAGKLSKDETTEIIESKKLNKDEIAMFEKIVQALSIKKSIFDLDRTEV